jgi:hypothetical protein
VGGFGNGNIKEYRFFFEKKSESLNISVSETTSQHPKHVFYKLDIFFKKNEEVGLPALI